MEDSEQPTLRFLHSDDGLVRSELERFDRIGTEDLLNGLLPGREGALKTREDGTVIDGRHRLRVLQNRGVNINALPREIVPKQPL